MERRINSVPTVANPWIFPIVTDEQLKKNLYFFYKNYQPVDHQMDIIKGLKKDLYLFRPDREYYVNYAFQKTNFSGIRKYWYNSYLRFHSQGTLRLSRQYKQRRLQQNEKEKQLFESYRDYEPQIKTSRKTLTVDGIPTEDLDFNEKNYIWMTDSSMELKSLYLEKSKPWENAKLMAKIAAAEKKTGNTGLVLLYSDISESYSDDESSSKHSGAEESYSRQIGDDESYIRHSRDDESNIVIDKSNTVADESNTVADESNTVIDESNTVIDESNTVIDESNTVIDESNTPTDESNTTTDESNTTTDESNTEDVEDMDPDDISSRKVMPWHSATSLKTKRVKKRIRRRSNHLKASKENPDHLSEINSDDSNKKNPECSKKKKRNKPAKPPNWMLSSSSLDTNDDDIINTEALLDLDIEDPSNVIIEDPSNVIIEDPSIVNIEDPLNVNMEDPMNADEENSEEYSGDDLFSSTDPNIRLLEYLQMTAVEGQPSKFMIVREDYNNDDDSDEVGVARFIGENLISVVTRCKKQDCGLSSEDELVEEDTDSCSCSCEEIYEVSSTNEDSGSSKEEAAPITKEILSKLLSKLLPQTDDGSEPSTKSVLDEKDIGGCPIEGTSAAITTENMIFPLLPCIDEDPGPSTKSVFVEKDIGGCPIEGTSTITEEISTEQDSSSTEQDCCRVCARFGFHGKDEGVFSFEGESSMTVDEWYSLVTGRPIKDTTSSTSDESIDGFSNKETSTITTEKLISPLIPSTDQDGEPCAQSVLVEKDIGGCSNEGASALTSENLIASGTIPDNDLPSDDLVVEEGDSDSSDTDPWVMMAKALRPDL